MHLQVTINKVVDPWTIVARLTAEVGRLQKELRYLRQAPLLLGNLDQPEYFDTKHYFV